MTTIDERNTANAASMMEQKLEELILETRAVRYQQVGMLACMILLGLMLYKVGKVTNQ